MSSHKRSQRVCRAVRYPHRVCLDEPALVSVADPEPAPEPAPGGLTRSCTGCSSMGAGCGRLPATWAVARTPSSAERVPRPGRNWPKAPGRGLRPGLGRARLARKCRYHGPSVAVREIADGAHRPSDAPHAVRHASVDTATPRATALHGDTTRDREKTARTPEKSQLAGRFRRWWQVLGSNQRRLSRRFYRPRIIRGGRPRRSRRPRGGSSATSGFRRPRRTHCCRGQPAATTIILAVATAPRYAYRDRPGVSTDPARGPETTGINREQRA